MLFSYNDINGVKTYLCEALRKCQQPCSTADSLLCIFVALEKASASACPDNRAPINSGTTKIFDGLYKYYCKKLKDKQTAFVQTFIQDALPTIIKLVLDNIDSMANCIPDDLEAAKYRWPHNPCVPLRVNHVEINRDKVAVALAMMFLCLLQRRPNDDYFNPVIDYAQFFDSLKQNAVSETYFVMILQYFEAIRLHGVPSGKISFCKLFAKKTSYFPNTFNDWLGQTEVLCDFEIIQDGSIDDDPSAISVDFANCFIGGSTLKAFQAQEEIMFFTHPELQVSMLFISCMGPYEAIQMKGHAKFTTTSGYGYKLGYTGPVRAVSPMKESSRYTVAIDAICYRSQRHALDQYKPRDMFLALTKALVGFTQVLNQMDDSTNSSQPMTQPKTSQDLAAINEYAESLTERVMEDMWSGLKLVIPDYFGFNVVHYNPLKDTPLSASSSSLNPYADESQPMETQEAAAASSDVTIQPESHPHVNLSKFIAKYATDLSSQIIEQSLATVYSQVTRPHEDTETNSCTPSFPKPSLTDESESKPTLKAVTASYTTDLSTPEVGDTVHKHVLPPNVTEKGDHDGMPIVELTTRTSNCTVPISVEVEMSVSRGTGSGLLGTSTSIPLHVEVSAAVNASQDIAVSTEVVNSPVPNIDIQVLVKPDERRSPDRTLQLNSLQSRPLLAQGSLKAATGEGVDVPSSPSAHSSDGLLSLLPISDSVKYEISQKALSMAQEILGAAYNELRERRRLLIENNISSVELNAARATSADVIGQIFNELQTEAENSIPDSEKLRKDTQVETYADHLITSTMAETHAEGLSHGSSSSSSSRSQARTMLSPRNTPARPSPSPIGYRDWCSWQNLTRRSSAPVPVRRSSLGSTARRVSEPSFSFRSRSAHASSLARLSDYMRQEFGEERRGVSRSSSLSSNRSAADHLWAEFNRHGNYDARSSNTTPCMRSPKAEKRSHSSCALPSCEEERDVTFSDGSLLTPSGSNAPSRQASLILPAITVNRPTSSASGSSVDNSTTDVSSHESVRFDLLNETGAENFPLASPMQHQYLKLFSEVLAENILHESLDSVRTSADQSERARLADVAEEECMEVTPPGPTGARRQPIATGNWGSGAFNGDPQLKSLLQWAAATKAGCPKLLYYPFGDVKVADLHSVVQKLRGRTIGSMLLLVSTYCAMRVEKQTELSLFAYIASQTRNQ
ncbi:mucin-4-like [Watersipora subatra]|uniref:mucin-4-like n=1 Tax=Watersipora subatra TaxID=2589382 RepID=UPI00355C0721